MVKPSKEQKASPDASVVERVLAAVAKERKEAHEDLDAANAELSAATRREDAAFRPIAQTFNEATRDVAAHARYKDLIPTRDWDAKQRELQRALDAATAAKDAGLEAAERRLAAPRRKAQNLTQRCLKLAEEWESHQRTAEAAGVDVRAYWAPDTPTPAKAVEAKAV